MKRLAGVLALALCLTAGGLTQAAGGTIYGPNGMYYDDGDGTIYGPDGSYYYNDGDGNIYGSDGSYYYADRDPADAEDPFGPPYAAFPIG